MWRKRDLGFIRSTQLTLKKKKLCEEELHHITSHHHSLASSSARVCVKQRDLSTFALTRSLGRQWSSSMPLLALARSLAATASSANMVHMVSMVHMVITSNSMTKTASVDVVMVHYRTDAVAIASDAKLARSSSCSGRAREGMIPNDIYETYRHALARSLSCLQPCVTLRDLESTSARVCVCLLACLAVQGSKAYSCGWWISTKPKYMAPPIAPPMIGPTIGIQK